MMHKFALRVYIEDTDLGGIVYHANYLKFVERARSEMLRGFGISQLDLKQKYDLIFVVRKMICEYILPAQYDDELVVETSVKELKRASVIFQQDVKRGDDLLFQTEVVVVAVGGKMRAIALPDELRDVFSKV